MFDGGSSSAVSLRGGVGFPPLVEGDGDEQRERLGERTKSATFKKAGRTAKGAYRDSNQEDVRSMESSRGEDEGERSKDYSGGDVETAKKERISGPSQLLSKKDSLTNGMMYEKIASPLTPPTVLKADWKHFSSAAF